jgi:hypothetical protein
MKLEEEAKEPTKRLAKDVKLFGNGEGSASYIRRNLY